MKNTVMIDGHRYTLGEWYTSKMDARDKAERLRKTGHFKGVRIIKRLADSRYAIYWVCTR